MNCNHNNLTKLLKYKMKKQNSQIKQNIKISIKHINNNNLKEHS